MKKNTRKTRVALLGAGRIGQVHAQALTASDQANLVAVADIFADSAQQLAQEHACRVDSAAALITAKDVDAVLIATATNTHADFIEQAARAGKAIFCEKPIDLSIQRVRTCLAVVAQTQAKLMLGFNRRFDPHFAAVHTALNAGVIGAVEQVQITSRDPAPPPIEYIRSSGGIFYDMMIHDLDMARFLLGEEPVAVQASGSVLVDATIGEMGDYDTAMAILTTTSGKQAMISNSRRTSYGYDQRIEVHGTNGMLSADNPRATTVEVASKKGYLRDPLHHFFMTRYTEAYRNEINAFVAWLRSEAVTVPNGEDGLRALLLADAALQSAQSGQKIAL